MAIWARAIEESGKVRTNGFIDDPSLRANSVEEVWGAWKTTKQFDLDAGLKTNVKKTQAWATTESAARDWGGCSHAMWGEKPCYAAALPR